MDADYLRLIDALAKLEERWRGQAISCAGRIDVAVVRERFASIDKRVSDDLVAIYSMFGGMLNSEMDDVYFSLWPLDYAIKRNREIRSEHWCFGDHLIESFWYASIYQSPSTSSVAMLAGEAEAPFVLATTLEDFFVRFAEASTEEERLQVVL